jgi:hypothetical protein
VLVLRRRAQPLEELARIAARRVREVVSVDEPVFAVTHSMGAVVMRHMEVRARSLCPSCTSPKKHLLFPVFTLHGMGQVCIGRSCCPPASARGGAARACWHHRRAAPR